MSSQCPCCHAEDEHLLHVLTCAAPDTIILRNNLLSGLILWLNKENTHPAITNFIDLGLRKWFVERDFIWTQDSAIFTSTPTTNQAFKSQLQIKWYYFLCGMVTTDLVAVQQQHYTTIKSRKMGSRWASNLTKKMWSILHTIWKNRCDKLHANDEVARLSGLIPLKVAIAKEYGLGLGEMPHVYSSFFHTPLQRLLKRGVTSLKRWFLIIRTDREANSMARDLDDFSFDGPLRKWIGLIDNG